MHIAPQKILKFFTLAYTVFQVNIKPKRDQTRLLSLSSGPS